MNRPGRDFRGTCKHPVQRLSVQKSSLRNHRHDAADYAASAEAIASLGHYPVPMVIVRGNHLVSIDQQFAAADMISEEYLLPSLVAGGHGRSSVDTLNPAELDLLPFGAIQLDHAGKLLQYNNYESELAGIDKSKAIGKNFFIEIAPCTDVKDFRGRFTEGVAAKKLHLKFRYHFSFKKNPRDVTVTLYYSPMTDSTWVFIRPV